LWPRSACTGWPSDSRNKFNAKQLKEIAADLKKFKQIDKVSPAKRFVKVDEEINGCPVHQKVVIAKIDSYLREAGL
jgi:coenzyme F420-reducing hydrogenase gamma subunit